MNSVEIPPPKLRDLDIRNAVFAQLVPAFTAGCSSRVIEEFQLLSGVARIDIAVANGRLHGFEIKSEVDSLSRLKQQANAYNQVFDTMTIICGVNHRANVESVVPRWWSIVVAKGTGDDVRIKIFRRSRNNPAVSPDALCHLLWRDEMLRLLADRDHSRSLKSATKPVLRSRLVSCYRSNELRDVVRETIKQRTNWRPDEPQK